MHPHGVAQAFRKGSELSPAAGPCPASLLLLAPTHWANGSTSAVCLALQAPQAPAGSVVGSAWLAAAAPGQGCSSGVRRAWWRPWWRS
jgi:hypothetical protein